MTWSRDSVQYSGLHCKEPRVSVTQTFNPSIPATFYYNQPYQPNKCTTTGSVRYLNWYSRYKTIFSSRLWVPPQISTYDLPGSPTLTIMINNQARNLILPYLLQHCLPPCQSSSLKAADLSFFCTHQLLAADLQALDFCIGWVFLL